MNQSNRAITAGESLVPSQNDTTGRYKCVADVMTRKTVTLSPHHGFGEAVSLMADRHFRHVVVAIPAGRLSVLSRIVISCVPWRAQATGKQKT